MRRRREAAESFAGREESGDAPTGDADSIAVTEPRELGDEESLTVRKVLACAARMGGRFGKGMLASVLRGSRSAKLSQAGLDQLSTYGILSGMTQDEILLYADALVVPFVPIHEDYGLITVEAFLAKRRPDWQGI